MQLKKLEAKNRDRKTRALRYTRELADLDWIERPVVQPRTKPAWHNYVIKTEHRNELNTFLAERGVSTGVHYIPNNHYPMYAKCRGKTPVCEKVWVKLLTLPLYPDLSARDQAKVIREVRAFGRKMGL